MARSNRSTVQKRRVKGSEYLYVDEKWTTGEVFFVHSGSGTNSATRGGTPNTPLATLAYALSLCTAGQGDVIILMPGHQETISSAGGITCSVEGVTIIGQGNGTNRPKFTFSTTSSTWAISAANVTVRNIRCTCSVDEVVKLFHVTAAYCTLDDVEFFETASSQAIQFLLTTNAADYLTVKNCVHSQATAAAVAQKWIQLVGVDNARIIDNVFFLTLSNDAGSVTISGSTAIVGGEIARNTIVQLGGTTQVSAILLVDSSTAFVHDNRCACGSTGLPGIVDVGNAGYACENYALNTPDKSGILDPTVDS